MLEEEDFETSVMAKGAYFLEGLKELQKRHRIIGEWTGLASRCALRSVNKTATPPTRR